jgi:hypothetical protein
MEASLYLAASTGIGAKLVFSQGENGLQVTSAGKNMAVLKTTTPKSLVAWATEAKDVSGVPGAGKAEEGR